MSIKILNPGLFSTIQDQGRIGFQNQGFSNAGVLDQYAYKLGQSLIGNEGPAIECTIIGPTLQFLADNTVIITGAQYNAKINDKDIDVQTVTSVKKGDVLELGAVVNGARGYILFGKPLDVPMVAGSYATHTRSHIGGYKGRALKGDDVILCKQDDTYLSKVGYSLELNTETFNKDTIQIIEGPQINRFTLDTQDKLTTVEFKISEKSDRMGYRLQGETISPIDSADIISEPVALGSIQVPNDGNPIILLNDKQTVGGYTKIATVCGSDLHILAQKQPGDVLHFEWITIEEATEKLKQQELDFKKILEGTINTPIYNMAQLRPTASRIKKILKGEL
ncbi:biotin-dependent carboxyltransferase family protein [Staphylococcus equorum]|uniref:Biotin-dependent carboxyltransferase family protein n=1 Tax=Staphylococcus equorum TaxID=246432 RepID=A0A9X4R2A0_9STAP|nr:biotin-dependent carboxyltransferase family protein [Staphylococcus equorum]MDG0842601.1 biotin-dependent carboxyltransferase family protein [Staphylococcus equorum]MDG0858268.1 biotin-dependent carboxyltransferase family protein [Staphylococcus equorum]